MGTIAIELKQSSLSYFEKLIGTHLHYSMSSAKINPFTRSQDSPSSQPDRKLYSVLSRSVIPKKS